MLTYDINDVSDLESDLNDLSAYKGKFYYNDYTILIEACINSIKGKPSLTTRDYQHLCLLGEMFNGNAKIIWLNACFLYAFRELEDINEINKFAQDLVENQSNILIKMNLYRYYVSIMQFDELLKLEKEITDFLKENNLTNHLFEFTSLTFRTKDLVYYQERKIKTNGFIEEINKHKSSLNDASLKRLLLNLTMPIYSSYREFNEAKFLFEILLDIDENNYEFYLLYWIDCCERLHLEVSLDYINKIEKNNSNVYLDYFILKLMKNMDTDGLIDYIMKSIVPSLIKSESKIIAEIFKYQLNNLLKTKSTKRYKDYYDFYILCDDLG